MLSSLELVNIYTTLWIEYLYTMLRKGFTQMLTLARLGGFRNGQAVQIYVLEY